MPDRTNAPYDPADAETSHEWAARVGEEHDTWHRLATGQPDLPNEVTGTFEWTGTYGQIAGPIADADFAPLMSIITVSANGVSLGKYLASISFEDGTFQTTMAGGLFIDGENYDGASNTSKLSPLNGQTVTFSWPEPQAPFPITLNPTTVSVAAGPTTITVTSPGGEMEAGMIAVVATNSFLQYPCTLVSPNTATFVFPPAGFAAPSVVHMMLRKADGTVSTVATIQNNP